MSDRSDPAVKLVAKTILRFDEVGEIRASEADYAWDLAKAIIRAQAEADRG